MYKVYGDLGFATQTILKEANTRSEAKAWVEDNYVNPGDFDGFTLITVVRLAENTRISVFEWDFADYEIVSGENILVDEP